MSSYILLPLVVMLLAATVLAPFVLIWHLCMRIRNITIATCVFMVLLFGVIAGEVSAGLWIFGIPLPTVGEM